MPPKDRIVVLIDMDCFYCQVEEKLNPALKGKPIAVVQYNQWQGGGIIAVNYLARAQGVTRHMRGEEAKKKCPEIELPSVPCLRGKADISKYREAGRDVALVLQEFTPLLERASVDEAYLDITQLVEARVASNKERISLDPNTFILGYNDPKLFFNDVYEEIELDYEISGFDQEHSLKLLHGAYIVHEIRTKVFERTGFHCSAGIAHNKILAKLVCGMNKPNKQTVLPKNSIDQLYESLPINKVKGLGGKYGELVSNTLKIKTMKEIIQFSEKDLQKLFDEKNGSWLYNIARGVDNEPVTPKFNAKSIGCCKKFPGKTAIIDLTTLIHWLKELGNEIEDRLKIDNTENNRFPTQMVVSFTKFINGKDVSCSRSINMTKDDIMCGETLFRNALILIKKDCNPFCKTDIQKSPEGIDAVKIMLVNHIKFLGIAVGKFEENNENESKKPKNIQEFFNQAKLKSSKTESESNFDEPSTSKQSEEQNKQSRMSPILLPGTSKATKEPSSESFILNYLKTFKKQSESPLKIAEVKSENTTPAKSLNSIEENSNDSSCSIDNEINKSNLLNDDEKDISKIEEIQKLRSSFNFPKIESSPQKCNSPLKSNVIYIECDQCCKKIPENHMIEHQDYHFALKIREEDRQLNRKIYESVNSEKVTLKQPKKSKAKISNTHCKDISMLFKNDETNKEGVEYQMCEDCNKNIELSKFLEHSDFHMAKKLYMELKSEQSSVIAGKRKREDNMESFQGKPNTTRKIDSYFKL